MAERMLQRKTGAMKSESQVLKAEHDEYLHNFSLGRGPSDRPLDFGLVIALVIIFFIEFLVFFMLMP
ncbi:MAG: hypothetical protein P9M14_00240 [Candidatus Alcyoniella australis]|nr:hypothetical protein [Candidatus Alcyoniella australis]